MTTLRRVSLAAALVAGRRWPAGAEAADKLRVVTTIPDLKSLTEAVGGDLVEVESLTRGTQNFHEAEVRPSMMLKLRRADLLVENGARARRLGRRRRAGRQQPDDRPRRPRAHRGLARASRCSRCPPRASTARWATSTRSATRTSRSTPAWRPPITAEHPRRAWSRVAPAAPRGLRAQPRGVPGPARRADGPLDEADGAVQGRQGRRLPSGLHLPPDALRPGPGRRRSRTGPASRPRRSTWPASSGR